MNLSDLEEYEVEEEKKPAMNLADLDDFEVEGQDASATEMPVIDEMSMLQSGGLGALQGLSFDFADEIEGGARAAGSSILDAIKGKGSISDIPAKYKELIPEIRARYDKARIDNPASYMTGDIGGSILPSLLTGGVGAAVGLGKGIAKEGIKQGVKQGGLALAKAGAIQGGLTGYGASEGETIGEDIKNTAIGAGVGAGAGVALPVIGKSIGKGISSLGSKTASIMPEITSMAKDAFKFGKAGKSVVGRKASEEINNESVDLAEKLLKNLDVDYSSGSKMMNKAITKSDAGKTNVSAQMHNIQKSLNDSKALSKDVEVLQELLDNHKRKFNKDTVLSTGEENTMQAMQELIDTNKMKAEMLNSPFNATSPEVDGSRVKSLFTSTNAAGETIADPKVMKMLDPTVQSEVFAGFENMSIQELMNLKKQVGDLAFGTSKTLDSGGKKLATEMYDKLGNTISNKIKDPSMRNMMNQGLKKTSGVHEASEFIPGYSPAEGYNETVRNTLAEKFKNQSDKVTNDLGSLNTRLNPKGQEILASGQELAERKMLNKATVSESSNPLLGFITPKSWAVRGGSAAGSVADAVAKSTPVNVYKKLGEMGDAPMKGLADILSKSNTPAIQEYSKRLTNAVSDAGKRDKLIWALSQQPAFREVISKALKEQEQNEEAVRGLETPQPVQPKQTEAEELDSILFPNL